MDWAEQGNTDDIPLNKIPTIPGTDVSILASGFDGNLATTDNTVQKVAQKLVDITISGGGGSTSGLSIAATAPTSPSLGNLWSDTSKDKLNIWGAPVSYGTYDNTKVFNTLRNAGNDSPGGIWSNGQYMWVVDWRDNKIYAYRMPSNEVNSSPGGTAFARESTQDFNTLVSVTGCLLYTSPSPRD